jgi:hypothetical protein
VSEELYLLSPSPIEGERDIIEAEKVDGGFIGVMFKTLPPDLKIRAFDTKEKFLTPDLAISKLREYLKNYKIKP